MHKEEIKEIELVLKRNKPFYEGGTYDYFECASIEKILQENKQLKDNWNKLKDFLNLKSESYSDYDNYDIKRILNKIQELEKGDSNE